MRRDRSPFPVAIEKALPAWLSTRRWFGGKARSIRRASVRDALPLSGEGYSAFLLLLEVAYRSGAPELYLLPVSSLPVPDPSALILRRGDTAWSECVSDPRFWSLLLSIVAKRRKIIGATGSIMGVRTAPWTASNLPFRPGGTEQSNSSAFFGDSLFLKLYRKLTDGINPEVEILGALAQRRAAARVAPLRGGIEYRGKDGLRSSLAILLRALPGSADAWSWGLEAFARFDRDGGRRLRPAVSAAFALLGKRTAELHLSLASLPGRSFSPVPFTSRDLDFLRNSISRGLRTLALNQKLSELSPWERHSCLPRLLKDLYEDRGRDPAQPSLWERRLACPERSRRAAIPEWGMKIRGHGDYHLGQVLRRRGDFVIIDFEGEPDRSPEERRARQSPLKDVAGMLRSFHYAASAHYLVGKGRMTRAEGERADLWAQIAGEIFLSAYLRRMGKNSPLLPPDPAALAALLRAFTVEKALYELSYELNHRPAWSAIPLRALAAL